MIGTAIAARLAAAGVDVCVVDRATPAAGTSSSGEGNVLVSDKLPGAELALALRGADLWEQVAERASGSGARGFEFERKGGLVVAHDGTELAALRSLADAQRAQGAQVEMVTREALAELEPALSRDLCGGALYEQDCQVQPMLAVGFHVDEILASGGRVVPGVEVLEGRLSADGQLRWVRTDGGTVSVGRCVVDAAGPWSGELAARLGADLQVQPRRGHVLVTEPLLPLVRRKVYEAGYVGSIHESGAGWTCSAVVEGTRAGTMLLGSSREFVGFSPRMDMDVMATIASRSIALVPALAGARLMRVYTGFRPATPDRLPVIGPDPVVGGLFHATGHEGAGVGLAQVTAELLAALVLGQPLPMDINPFAADRFPPGSLPAPAAAGEALTRTAVRPPAVHRPAAGGSPAQRPPEGTSAEAGAGGVGHALAGGRSEVKFWFEGKELFVPGAMTVAGALLANGERAFRTTRAGGQERGLFCGIGTCFECLVELNGECAVRACMTVLKSGDQVRRSLSVGLRPKLSAPPSPVPPLPATPGRVEEADVIVVGGGPGGMATAAAAAARGARVVIVDAWPHLGGQYLRQPLSDGSGAAPSAGRQLPSRFRPLAAGTRARLVLGTGVWAVRAVAGGFAAHLDDGSGTQLLAPALVLATGASELVVPFPGWELPGVTTAGAAQALFKSQGAVVGRRVLVAGTGPFLLPVAVALAEGGARVSLVEAAPARSAPYALASLLGHPAKLAEAAGYAASLARHGVQVLTGRAVVRCEGDATVRRALVARLGPGWRPLAGTERPFDVDAVCTSYGFVPRLELARQLGVRERSHPAYPGSWVATGADMATSVPGLYVAGELAGVAGAKAAELEGELAGHAAASYLGLIDGRPRAQREVTTRRLAREREFAARLARLYPVGNGWLSWLDEGTLFCRCEEVPWSVVRATLHGGARTLRDVRNLSRCGMGYCQGRTCGPALELALSALAPDRLGQGGDFHKRPVAVPVPLGVVAGQAGAPAVGLARLRRELG